MSVRPIVIYPNDVLTTPCELVTEFKTAELIELVAEMLESMYAFRGVGLAANQIGVSKQVAVIDTWQDGRDPLVVINPRIYNRDGNHEPREGCLSVPGAWEFRPRSVSVDFLYQDIRGNEHKQRATWTFAQAIQHECDHLAGRLCLSNFALKRFVDAQASEAIAK